jgi:catechol 2,3-dioxygenase-like lactoylglutathione lyase family enzyme
VSVAGFENLALKVADLPAAIDWYRSLGAEVGEPESWEGGRRVDLNLAGLPVTLFTRALYETSLDLADECFLHAVFRVDDLEAALAGREVLWGPEVVAGSFGVRRIAFLEAPGGIRVELMEQLEGGGR